jgi:hypothetical protein
MLSGPAIRAIALTIVFSAGSGGARCAPLAKTKSPIEGKWLVTFFAIQYNRVSESDTGDTVTVETDMTLTIRDGKMTITAGTDSFTWKVDRVEYGEGKVGEIDLTAETAKLQPQKGIFSLDKDVLVLRYPPNAADRPKELKIKPNEEGVLIRAKRVE